MYLQQSVKLNPETERELNAEYNRLKNEAHQKAYLKVMPKLTIFSTEQPRTDDTLRERLRAKGLTDETITQLFEGLDL